MTLYNKNNIKFLKIPLPFGKDIRTKKEKYLNNLTKSD
jgi:hypothetical protein